MTQFPRTREDEARRLIACALTLAPDLGGDGFGSSGSYIDWKQVALVADWLKKCPRRRTVDRYGSTSYGYKHWVERWARRELANGNDGYVSNGAFIAAALGLGFEFERCHDGLNAVFNISRSLPADRIVAT